ncbi:MAG: hypothetical protein R3F20_05455 [Planctomycetota bacterium]
MFRPIPLILALAALAPLLSAQGEEVRELYPNGKVRVEYKKDKTGEIQGAYEENYEDGAKKIRARYDKGRLDGNFELWQTDGKRRSARTYKRGELDSLKTYDARGEVVFSLKRRRGGLFASLPGGGDFPLHPRDRDEIRRGLDRIDPADQRVSALTFATEPSTSAPFAPGRLDDAVILDAVRHLNAYRFLSYLPAEVKPDAGYSELSQCAALAFALNGATSHDPARPAGLADALFKKAVEGAKESNLYQGSGNPRRAIDGFMEDADERNARAVGHRRGILSTTLAKSGLGAVGRFYALHVKDASKPGKLPLTWSYPGAGHYPIEYLTGPRVPWHLSWDESRVKAGKEVSVECYLLDADHDLGERLEIKNVSRDEAKFGGAPALIFRPVLTDAQFAPGLRVLVRVKGLDLPRKQSADYLVELYSLGEKR